MHLDQLSLTIEKMAADCGSYIEAMVEFAENNHIEDIEEVLILVHPTLYEKVKIEFIERNYFRDKKIDNSLKDFFI